LITVIFFRMAAILTVVLGFALQHVVCLEQQYRGKYLVDANASRHIANTGIVAAEQAPAPTRLIKAFSPEQPDEYLFAARQGRHRTYTRQSFLTASVSVPDASLTTLTTSAIQTATETLSKVPSGTIVTSLQTSGVTSLQPFPTFTTATRPLSIVDVSILISVKPTLTKAVTALDANNIFQPIATDAPPSQIPSRGDHPVPRLNIERQQPQTPLQTNKFFDNLFLGDQAAPVFTYPYAVSWSKGGGSCVSWGLAVSHTERVQLAAGLANPGYDAGEWSFYINPLGVQSIILSASELGSDTQLTTDSIDAFSLNANLVVAGSSSPTITFPLVQGMGFVTGVYRSATPLLQSGVGIQRLVYAGKILGTMFKYRVTLGNGFTWLIYVTPSDSNYEGNTFTLVNAASIQGPSGFDGLIQVAKVPWDATDDIQESIYDLSAGAYVTGGTISGAVEGKTGSYEFVWTKRGNSDQKLLMFALPHHITSLVSGGVQNLNLMTTTKGMATAILADYWTFKESNLPIDMSFAPWTPARGSITKVDAAAVLAINLLGYEELQQNISAQANVGSLYYDGKALAKFAAMIYTIHDMGGNKTLALSGLKVLQQAFEQHVNNEMTWPLAYDSAWGGVVSSATYATGNSGVDFGNTYYNDRKHEISFIPESKIHHSLTITTRSLPLRILCLRRRRHRLPRPRLAHDRHQQSLGQHPRPRLRQPGHDRPILPLQPLLRLVPRP
jgi:endo-1,3(4)-beta-glucanase